jgi:methylmalonyl-CoA epimerase
MISKITHIGIAVGSLEKRLAFWAQALGMELAGIETVASEKVRVAMLPAGSSRIELLEAVSDDSAVARHIARRGEGLHHVALEVSDIEEAVGRLERMGVTPIGEAPRAGAEGRRVAFLHPRDTGGVLLELVEGAEGAALRETEIAAGSVVLLYLREPQEKLWGVLRRLDASGVVIEGIDLASFDDWISQIEKDEDSVVGPSILFLPMGRIEKVMLDRPSGDIPSLAESFERRTGKKVAEVLKQGGY